MKKTDKEKIYKGIIVVLLLIIAFGGSYFASELKENSCKQTATTNELKSISYSDYKKLKAGKELSIIYVARPGCSFCQQQSPIVKQILGTYSDLTINYMNTDNMGSSDLEEFIKSYDVFKGGENFGTPTFLIVGNNKIVDSKIGYTEQDSLIQFFKDHKLIKE